MTKPAFEFVIRKCRLTIITLFICIMAATVVCAAPSVTFTTPIDGAGNVSTNALIKATFSDRMDPAVVAQNFRVYRRLHVVAVAAGKDHSLVLRNDGTVAAWGSNVAGVSNIPAGLSDVTAIAAGASHSVALKSDGTVVAWGSSGQTAVPAGLTEVVAISAGTNHTVALKNDGTVVAWGQNSNGQTTVPAGLTQVKAVAAGGAHTLALREDGSVVAWGSNSNGQITIPSGLSPVIAIAAGETHSVALKENGTVVTWGRNITSVPANLSNVIAIAAGRGKWGQNHTVALKDDGTVVAWGDNSSGQSSVPAGLFGISAIAAGGSHTLVLKNDCTVVAWGARNYGQTDIPTEESEITEVALGSQATVALRRDMTVEMWGSQQYLPPAGLTGVTAVAARERRFYAVKSDGTVTCWGELCSVPAGLTGVTAISASTRFTVALKDDGTVVPWGTVVPPGPGYDGWNQIPAGLSGVTAIASTEYAGFALKNDGSVVCYGDCRDKAVPTDLQPVASVAAGSYHAIAVMNGGTPVTWSKNLVTYLRDLRIPAGLTGVTQVAAAADFSLALKSDGSVVTWGQTSMFAALPPNLANVTAIAAGRNGIATIRSDGSVVATATVPYLHQYGNIYASAVSGAVTYDPATLTATFRPDAPLAERAAYTASIGKIRSWTGEKLPTPVYWTFATANYDPAPSCCSATASYEVIGSVEGDGGTISCLSPVSSGATSICTVVPAEGYQLLNLADNSADVTAYVNDTTYTLENVVADHTVVARFTQTPVHGLCGSADGQSLASAPSANLCSAGTATAVTGSGPWTWSCTGLYGGSVASCSAEPSKHSLSVAVTGSGTVHSAPGSDINCSGGCSQPYSVGSTVDLASSPGVCSYFTGWSGACTGTGDCRIVMNQDQSVGATFMPDTTPPVMGGLVDRIIEATSPFGAVANFIVTATDNLDPKPEVTCSPRSGSTFALGATPVTCAATDTCKKTATGSFTVKVGDTTPPVLTVPQDITVLLNTPVTDPAVQAFLNGATATDIVDLSVSITYTTPALDSVGPKIVTFTAVDDYNNRTTLTAKINVVYGCGDQFDPPVSLRKPFKQGSTIPVKFRLCDASGADVLTAVARLYLQRFSGGVTVGGPIEVTSTSGADTANYFRIAGDKYMYNLYTKSLPSDSYEIQAILDDGTKRTIPLSLKP